MASRYAIEGSMNQLRKTNVNSATLILAMREQVRFACVCSRLTLLPIPFMPLPGRSDTFLSERPSSFGSGITKPGFGSGGPAMASKSL